MKAVGLAYEWCPPRAGAASEIGAVPNKKVSDGIKFVYQEFTKQVAGLTEATAPVLHQYLNDTLENGPARAGEGKAPNDCQAHPARGGEGKGEGDAEGDTDARLL